MSTARRIPAALAAAAVLAAAALAGCTSTPEPQAPPPSSATPAAATGTATPPRPAISGKVTVLAASSLTEAYRQIGAAFQQANPGVTVEFNFGASSALATQIDQAAPADVFAGADAANMTKLSARGLVEGVPAPFVKNLPVIVVPAANRAGIASAKDLARPGTKLVLAGPDVPIGNYARQIIDRLAATPEYGAAYRDAALQHLVSNEQNVRAVLTKIELGEAEAGIVYRTDALASKEKVRIIEIPAPSNVIALYPMGVLKASKQKDAANAFIATTKLLSERANRTRTTPPAG